MKNKRGSIILKDKKAQGLSTNAIILIILGVVILVVLILGFTIGWKRISPWIGKSNNIEDIKTACSVACSTENTYGWCELSRKVKDGENEFEAKCDQLASGKIKVDGRTIDTSNYGINNCSAITC